MSSARSLAARRAALALVAAVVVVLPAAPAFATVDDQAGVLSPDARAHLQQDLAQLGHHRFDVVLVANQPGKLEAFAHKQFDLRHLSAGDALISVDTANHRVAAHVGSAFRSHGLSNQLIGQSIHDDFLPQAKLGHLDLATENLAKGLLARTSSTVVAQPMSPATMPPHHSFPWGLVFVVAVIGAGAWWVLRQKGGASLTPRIGELKARHAKVVNQALRLDDVETLGRFREGDVASEYKILARRSSELLTESREFGERVLEAETLAKNGKAADAEALVVKLEDRVVGLSAEVAASVTTLERLEGTTGLTGDERDLPKLVQRLSRRQAELSSAYQELRRRAAQGYDKDSTVESRLAECERLLTTVPVDAKEAERAILDATDALDAYRRSVEGESDRIAVRQGGGWSGSGSYLPYVYLPTVYERPYFYSTYYEPPVVIYQDAGGWGGSGGGAEAEASWGGSPADSGGGWSDERRDTGWGGDSGDASGSWGGDSGGSDSGGGWDSGSSGGGDW